MKIINCFLLASLLSCSITHAAHTTNQTTPNKSPSPSLKLPTFKRIGSLEWVKEKMKSYPELVWLLDENVQHTQEGKSQQFAQSWSMQLTGSHYPEFERTILSMKNLHLILDGSKNAYHQFTQLQKDDDRLSFESFKKLHHFAQSVVNNDPERLKALEINLLLGDMGKTHIARGKAEKFGINEPDHDLFLDKCLERCPELFSSFMMLPDEIQQEIKNVTGLVHFGHVTHVEGGPEILKKLKSSGIFEKNPQGFDFEILTHICDVSAARGHENNQGSLVLTENTLKALNLVKETLQYLATHNEQDTLSYYLKHRAEWLGLKNLVEHEVFIIARLGAMMRLFTPMEGQALIEGYKELSQAQKLLLNKEFNPLVIRHERTPTYIPAVLVNLQSSLAAQGLTREQSLQKCLLKGVPLITQILHEYRNGKATIPYTPEITLNFNKVAGQVRENLDLLDTASFTISHDGNIELVSRL